MIDVDVRPSVQSDAYVDYMLTAPLPSAPADPLIGSSSTDTVVYVIDLSGSMGVTTKVPSLQGDCRVIIFSRIAHISISRVEAAAISTTDIGAACKEQVKLGDIFGLPPRFGK